MMFTAENQRLHQVSHYQAYITGEQHCDPNFFIRHDQTILSAQLEIWFIRQILIFQTVIEG